MRKPRLVLVATTTIVCVFLGSDRLSSAVAAERLTYVDLIGRLTDLEHLATLPAPGERCAQWSSYDRRSTYDPASGKYVAWSANGDGSGIIRKRM